MSARAALPAGVRDRISPHWLWHAHASHALDNKAPISLVQQTLGHGSLKMTSIYADAKPEDSSTLYLKEGAVGSADLRNLARRGEQKRLGRPCGVLRNRALSRAPESSLRGSYR